MFTDLQIKLDVLNVFKFLFIFSHCAADKAVLLKFLLHSVFGNYQGIDGFMNFRIRIVIMKLPLDSFF
jgi:hypothetical protein